MVNGKMKTKLALIFWGSVFLTGCVSIPKTAEDLRSAAREGSVFLKKPESFIVDRPFAAVVSTFKKMAPECLEVQASTQTNPAIGFKGKPRIYGIAKSTVNASADKMELYLQIKTVGNLMTEPEGGQYMFVADATPVDQRRTRIDIYRTSMRSDVLLDAITGWASGKNPGCPDPKSFM